METDHFQKQIILHLLTPLKYIVYVPKKLYQRYKNYDKNNYSLEISGNQQVRKISNYMYQNSSENNRLSRKYDRYKHLLQQYQN